MNTKQRIYNIFLKVLNGVVYTLIAIFLFYFAVLGYSKIKNPNGTPDFFGYKSYIIISGSMESELNIDDLVVIKKVNTENELNVGDIISFKHDGIVVTHRIINIDEENGEILYSTKGDNNNIKDNSKVSYKNIEGKYQFKIEKVGKIVDIVKSKITITVLIVILIIWYFLKNNGNKSKKLKMQ